jgi:hypothetical protein
MVSSIFRTDCVDRYTLWSQVEAKKGANGKMKHVTELDEVVRLAFHDNPKPKQLAGFCGLQVCFGTFHGWWIPER